MSERAESWAPRAEPADVARSDSPRASRRDLAIVAAALAVHLLLAALVLLFAPGPQPTPEVSPVKVDILDSRQFEAMFGPQDANLPAPVLQGGLQLPNEPPTVLSFPAGPPLPPHAGETIVARTFLSGRTLANPASAGARLALTQMGGNERVVQLCVIETLDQIAALDDSFQPDLVSAYAMEELWLGQRTVDAPGAAFRSKGTWYNLSFRCTLTPQLDRVAAYQFRLGAEIPHQDWAAHNLAEGEDLEDH